MTRDEKIQQAASDLDRDGFAVLRGFFSPVETQALHAELDRYVAEVVPRMSSKMVFFEDKARPETVLRVEKMNEHDPAFQAFIAEGSMRQLAEGMLGCPVTPKYASLFGKAPRVGDQTPPHQDAYYWWLNEPAALTTWIAVDPVDAGNGCVRFVSGSHKGPMRPHGKSQVFGFSQSITDYSDDDRRLEVPVTLEPGDLSVHHAMTIHRADPNRSDRFRRALGLVYHAAHVRVDQDAAQAYNEKLKAEWAAAGKL